MNDSIAVKRYSSLNDISKECWEKDLHLPLTASYNFLKAVEISGINNIIPNYLRFYQKARETGRANIYIVDTDFSSMDSDLPENARKTIKKWYPGFMTFKTAECGYFTMIGEGLTLSGHTSPSEVLPLLIKEMDVIANKYDADINLIRDIPLDKYKAYWDILKHDGYYPALGFPTTCLPIKWNTIDDYLNDLKHKRRKYYKKCYLLKENLNIDYKFIRNYKDLCPIIENLCLNVNKNTKDYNREILSRKYFEGMAEYLANNSEVLVFYQNDKIRGVCVNVFDNTNYICLDWGVDYDFHQYKKANLIRAATFFNLKRAIDLGMKNLMLEITNYSPKMLLGANALPLIYFIKHNKKNRFSKTFAQLITKYIKQPDNNLHKPFKNKNTTGVDLQSLALSIKEHQNEILTNDIFYKVSNYYKVDSLHLSGLYGAYPEFKSAQESSVIIKNKRVILLGTNSYLGAANHPDVIKAAKDAMDRYGTGCSGSPLLNGTLDIHNFLETDLAEFLNREAVALFSTGYQTNLAGISSLCQPGDFIIMDERSHRSLFDGARLSGAKYYAYRHNDMAHLEKILSHFEVKPKIIITDSIFSMEGTLADLKTICKLAKTYNARVFVDEAHAVGVLGQNGRGVCELLGVEDDVDLIMCTFSKSFASIGGFIAGNNNVIDFIKHNAGGHIFSASLPPSAVATIRAVLTIIKEKSELRKNILEKAEYMATSLNEMGYNSQFHGTQIVPIIFGNQLLSLAAYKKFLEQGIYVNPTGPPAVPEESSGFRTSYIATHKWEDLRYALDVFKKYRKDFNAQSV